VDFETKAQIEERRQTALSLRKEAMGKLIAERFFVTEVAKKYPYVKIPTSIKRNIRGRLGVDLGSFDQKRVKLLVVQVEALFVFAVLKSVVMA